MLTKSIEKARHLYHHEAGMKTSIFNVFTILLFLLGSCNQKDDLSISLEIVEVYTIIENYDQVYKTRPINSITMVGESSTSLYFEIKPPVPLEEILITKTTGSEDSSYPIAIGNNTDDFQYDLPKRSPYDTETDGQLYRIPISTNEKGSTYFELDVRVFSNVGSINSQTITVSVEDPNFPDIVHNLEGKHEKDSIMIWNRFPFAFRHLTKDSVLLTLPHGGDNSYLGFELFNESEGLLYEYSAAYYETNLTETD